MTKPPATTFKLPSTFISYMGSKRRFLKYIFGAMEECLGVQPPGTLLSSPKVDHFYDIFGGGAAVSIAARAYFPNAKVHYNDKGDIYALIEYLSSEECASGTRKLGNVLPDECYRFYNKKEYRSLYDSEDHGHKKGIAVMAKQAYSYSNISGNYAYSANQERIKKLLHEVIIDSNRQSLEELNKWFIDIEISSDIFSIVDKRERRLFINKESKKSFTCARSLSTLKITALKEHKDLKKELGIEKVDTYNFTKADLEALEGDRDKVARLIELEKIIRYYLFSPRHIEYLDALERVYQSGSLKGIEVSNLDYREIDIKPNSIVYLDPPYFNTNGYSSGIDQDEFVDWVLSIDAPVFLSEYLLNKGLEEKFTEVYSINTSPKNKRAKGSICTERLYWNGKTL